MGAPGLEKGGKNVRTALSKKAADREKYEIKLGKRREEKMTDRDFNLLDFDLQRREGGGEKGNDIEFAWDIHNTNLPPEKKETERDHRFNSRSESGENGSKV